MAQTDKTPAKPAPAAVKPSPQPPPRETTFHERVAATGSGAASEDPPNSMRHVKSSIEGAEDPHNGPVGRAQADGGSEAITQMVNDKGPDRAGPLD